MKYLKLFEQMDDEEDWWEKESPFDKLEDNNFKIGDYVVIVNNSWHGKFYIGSVGIIKNESSRYGYEVFNKNTVYPGIGWWYKGDGDIRKATKEEINNYLK